MSENYGHITLIDVSHDAQTWPASISRSMVRRALKAAMKEA